jgi:hypothetical protein
MRSGEVQVWSIGDGVVRAVIQSQSKYERGLAIGLESRSVIGIGNDFATPVAWDVETGKEIRKFVATAGKDKVVLTQELWPSPDGSGVTTMTSVSDDGAGKHCLIRWDIRSGKEIDRIVLPRIEWQDVKYALSPDGEWVFHSGIVNRIEPNSKMKHVDFGDLGIRAPQFTSDGRYAAIPFWPRMTQTDADPGVLVLLNLTTLKRSSLPSGKAMLVQFSPDKKYVALTSADAVSLWEIAARSLIRRFQFSSKSATPTAISFTRNGRHVVIGSSDGTALVWDFAKTTHGPKGEVTPLSNANLDSHWEALAGTDPVAAYDAGWELADRPAKIVAKCRAKLTPIKPAEEAVVRRWLKDLDDPVFSVRERAERELITMGDEAVGVLRTLAAGPLSFEQTSRVKRILSAADTDVLTGDMLRQVRAVAILERADTPDSRAVLDSLASGVANARLTREAKSALARMKR